MQYTQFKKYSTKGGLPFHYCFIDISMQPSNRSRSFLGSFSIIFTRLWSISVPVIYEVTSRSLRLPDYITKACLQFLDKLISPRSSVFNMTNFLRSLEELMEAIPEKIFNTLTSAMHNSSSGYLFNSSSTDGNNVSKVSHCS